MKRAHIGIAVLAVLAMGLAACGADSGGASQSPTAEEPTGAPGETVELKDAKLNIEHNATDLDTGFQGFVDGEGWQQLDVTGRDGVVLTFQARNALGRLGMTELFFETVEPENAEVSIEEMLAMLPAGDYTIAGPTVENGVSTGMTSGTALLTHNIPAGPELLSPAEGEVVPAGALEMSWAPVTETIAGTSVTIIAYQLIIETDEDPHPNMIGKFGLSIYVPATVTSLIVPDGFLEQGTVYQWEVLAIEESGNQTLSSSEFETE